MSTSDLQFALLASSLVLALVSLGLVAWRQRSLARERLVRLEDALRVYNNANASVGRHVTSLEREVGQLRDRLAAAPRVQAPEALESVAAAFAVPSQTPSCRVEAAVELQPVAAVDDSAIAAMMDPGGAEDAMMQPAPESDADSEESLQSMREARGLAAQGADAEQIAQRTGIAPPEARLISLLQASGIQLS